MNTNTINSKNVISGVNDLATKCPKISAMWYAKSVGTTMTVNNPRLKSRACGNTSL